MGRSQFAARTIVTPGNLQVVLLAFRNNRINQARGLPPWLYGVHVKPGFPSAYNNKCYPKVRRGAQVLAMAERGFRCPHRRGGWAW